MESSLTEVLSLELIAPNHYRAHHHKENFQNTLFGGQVLAQSLMAACSTVDGLLPHSMHAYFLKAGSRLAPVDYHVETSRDGRSFSHRIVTAEQNGQLIFSMMASFHQQEEGFEHSTAWQRDYPLPTPEGSQPPSELAADERRLQADAFEFYPLSRSMLLDIPTEPGTQFWMRCRESIAKDAIQNACALAYASDFGLLATSLNQHAASLFKGGVMGASIDHALWFHDHNFDVREWLLYEIDSPWAGKARGLSRGRIYDSQGKLVASTTQEGLIRPLNRP